MFIQPVKLKSDRGASLVEVIVAILILIVAIVPGVYTTRSALAVGEVIKNNLTATFLAEEGVEVARALRDADWFSERAFGTSLGDGQWQVEWDSISLQVNGNTPLLIDTNGEYNYTSGTPTMFTRRLDITRVSVSQIRVIATVTWTYRQIDRSVSIESNLFDWR